MSSTSGSSEVSASPPSLGADRPHPRPDPRAGGGGPVVLVVEDDRKFASLLCRALGRGGFRTEVAGTGDDALRRMRRDPPEAVVLDIMIPHPDGIEVCRQFRRDGWNGAVVVVSARSSPEDEARVRRAGADRFLAKPFPLGDLVEVVRTSIDDRSAS